MRKRSQLSPAEESQSESQSKPGPGNETQHPFLGASMSISPPPRSVCGLRRKRWFVRILIGVFSLLVALAFHSRRRLRLPPLGWTWRRKMQKTALTLRSSIPRVVRHPLLSYAITTSRIESVHSDWHPDRRDQRFPSPEERVRLYMSNWYRPPCGNGTGTRHDGGRFAFRYDVSDPDAATLHVMETNASSDSLRNDDKRMAVESWLRHDRLVLLQRNAVDECVRRTNALGKLLRGSTANKSKRPIRMRKSYCRDMLGMMDVRDGTTNATAGNPEIPLVVVAGDGLSAVFDGNISIPVLAKYRWAATTGQDEKRENVTNYERCVEGRRGALPTTAQGGTPHLSPIIWKLNSERHWAPLEKSRKHDIPWKLKKNTAVWRGVLTGSFKGVGSLERCRSSLRCNFVLQHADSDVMDVGVTALLDGSGIERVTGGVNLVRPLLSFEDMQEHKIIVSLEGNDVSSGLKWQLLSKSVVIMSPPTKTSWAMEELLVPWVHYVPMHSNGSNAEEMARWVIDHDRKALRIAERATLFIEDMVYHPDAAKEEIIIREEIIRRYSAHWIAAA